MRKGEFDSEMTPAPRERKTKSAEQAYASLMRLCARAEKSTGDAMRLMHTWGVPQSERQGVVDRLVAERFIDNRRYAEAYSREKSQLSGWGARKIALQLRQKGVESAIIEDITRMLDDADAPARLEARLRRKLRTTKASSGYELRVKLLRYAATLGYDYDVSYAVVDKIIGEER